MRDYASWEIEFKPVALPRRPVSRYRRFVRDARYGRLCVPRRATPFPRRGRRDEQRCERAAMSRAITFGARARPSAQPLATAVDVDAR